MRIVARDATKLTLAVGVAAALVHLLNVADEAFGVLFVPGVVVFGAAIVGGKIDGYDGRPGEPRAKILAIAAARFDAEQPPQVALLADRFSQCRRQACGVYDGSVMIGRRIAALCAPTCSSPGP